MEGVKYFSKSRGEFVEIAPMQTRHLSNAAKKLANEMEAAHHETLGHQAECPINVGLVVYADFSPADVLCAMIDELASRVPAKDAPPSGFES